jgi:hypothetical protein
MNMPDSEKKSSEQALPAEEIPSSPALQIASRPIIEPLSPALEALRWFYERLILADSDRAKLWRKRGDEAPLDQADLLNHMRVQAYWVPPRDSNRGHQIRFGRDRQKKSCWCIRVDARKGELHAVVDSLNQAEQQKNNPEKK